jgi:NADH-quinone oxidoreductase subunit C
VEGSEPVVAELSAALGAGLLGVQTDRGETTLVVDRGSIREACRLLRDGAEMFAHLSFICGVDYLDMGLEPRYAVVYQLYSPSARRQLRVKVPVEASDPVVPSVVEVFTAAGWHERETFDMYGIQFEGHPNLTRILMPEDADFFPLRKDVPLGGEEVQFTHTEEPIHLPHRPKDD